MVRALFFIFVMFALLGDARIFLFVMNRVVFGAHKHEKSPGKWLMFVLPPVLLFLTALFWPVNLWIERLMDARFVGRTAALPFEDVVWSLALAKLGLVWLIIAASIGLFWVVDRLRVLSIADVPLIGVRSLPSEVIRLRRAHVPFAFLRNLGAHNDVYDLEITRHEVFIDDLPAAFDGYRIAFLTDTHVASFMRRDFFRTCVDQVKAFHPDVVLLGGDFVTWNRHIPLMAELLLDGLEAGDGVFAVLGNHDYWAGADEITKLMTDRGVRFVINQSVTLRRVDQRLTLVGIDEIYRGRPDVEAAFAAVDPSRPCIGLSHHPDIIDLVSDRRIDLLVCGHTHGGQIRFPFFGAVVVPSKHEARYASGFHRLRNVLMYVSRGIGAIPPLRILCRPEVATFILRRGSRI